MANYANRDLMIDLRQYIPTFAYPDVAKMATIFSQTLSIGNFPRHRVVITRGDRQGKFRVRLIDPRHYEELNGKSIRISPPAMRGREHRDYLIYLRPYQNEDGRKNKTKEITLYGTFEDEFIDLEDNDWDKYFETYGTIKTPTVKEEVHGVYTGIRTIHIELFKDTHIEKKVQIADLGEISVKYRGQPYFCKLCNDKHVFCQRAKTERERLEKIRYARSDKVDHVIIGTSNLRHVNQDALTADIICSPGAKIGHLANQLEVQNLDKYETVTLLGGCNNYAEFVTVKSDDTEKTNDWVKQVDNEIKALEHVVEKVIQEGKEVIISSPLNMPLTEKNCNTANQKTIMTKKLMTMKEHIDEKTGPGKLFIVSPPDRQPTEYEDYTDDLQHLTTTGTARLLQTFDEFLTAIPGRKRHSLHLHNGENSTLDKFSRGVTTAHPFGCRICCRIGHMSQHCSQYTREKENQKDLRQELAEAQKRARESSNSSPDAKKPTLGQ